ncbi:MAG TPA: two-component regulator propeller domain-containing protein [Pyrinomonadaceae bacterium]|nr:two-component regulator propeller domain-containing protein [Pyrinomonadaceae bacterium]
MRRPRARTEFIRDLMVCALFCLFAGLPLVRAEILPIKAYTTSDGLAHDRVNRIIRDSRGFLWFCTSEGLSRFDGYEFKNYTQDDGLPHRAVYDFLETKDGEFWAATLDGVVLFDPAGVSNREKIGQSKTDAPMFRTFRPADLKTAPATWAITDLLEDRDGKIWAASSHGLYQLTKQAGVWRLERFEIPPAAADRIEEFTALLLDSTGSVWAATALGLYRILPGNAGIQTINKKMSVMMMLEDREHRIWVGSKGGDEPEKGLHLFAYAAEDAPREIRVYRKRDGLSDDYWINALLETADGRIFVGIGNGLCEFTPQADQRLPQFRTLSNEGIVALGEDPSGNIWFSTNSSGVRRLAQGGFVNFDETDNLGSKKIGSIISASDGETYVLSSGFKINRFNGKGFDAVAPRKMIPGNWGTGQITFRDHLGAWWVSGSDGLQRYPPVGKLEDLVNTEPLKTYTTKDGLFTNEIFRLFEDSRGDIWISTIGNVADTVMRWERATDTFHGFTTKDNFPARNGPTAFGEDRAGNIWIGFYSGGLIRYRAGKAEVFTAADNLPAGYIHNIFTDSAGRIWVATSAGGVVRFDDPTSAEKPVLTTLTTRDGLSSNQATCVTEDNFGRIYISTGRGVNRLNLQNGRIKIFTKADGLPENIVNQCRRDAVGALWFGTNNGLARYVPVAEEQNKPPPIFLSGLRVNGETVKKLSELGETEVKDLDFASDQRQIQIDFFALGFGTGEALRYQYKVNGEDWSAPGGQRTINLDRSPGSYIFQVRAVNADGIASENPATVSFTIARPVWQRWWFLVLLTLAIVGLIYLVYSYRLKRLLELEKVRTRIATDLHDDIGASLSKIAILSEVVHQRVAPVAPGNAEINEPLEEIAGTSRELVDSMSDIVWAINPERDHLSDLIQRMRNLAGELTEFADIGLRVKLTGIETDADLPLGADLRREIYLIFKETVNNMVKHSACEMAEVSFGIENDHLVVSVKDDGKGFAPVTNGNGANGNGGAAVTRGGNGLPNMKRRAANMNGSYEITSEKGKGTTVVLRVPLQTGLRGFSLKNLYRKN